MSNVCTNFDVHCKSTSWISNGRPWTSGYLMDIKRTSNGCMCVVCPDNTSKSIGQPMDVQLWIPWTSIGCTAFSNICPMDIHWMIHVRNIGHTLEVHWIPIRHPMDFHWGSSLCPFQSELYWIPIKHPLDFQCRSILCPFQLDIHCTPIKHPRDCH